MSNLPYNDPKQGNKTSAIEELIHKKPEHFFEQKVPSVDISQSDISVEMPLLNKMKKKYKETCSAMLKRWFCGPTKQINPRKIFLNGEVFPKNYFENIVKNQKYNIFTFVPVVLFNQFKFFFNLFFLIIAISQFIPPLKVGFLFTYLAPLIFVLVLTMAKEFYDDLKRYQRDKDANSAKYEVLTKNGRIYKPSSDLKVGNIIEVVGNQRIPADIILLYTQDSSGTVFIRTDQLDGETDWKLRKSINFTQNAVVEKGENSLLQAQEPILDIYEFVGVFSSRNFDNREKIKEPLSLEQTMWANTVLASGKILGMVTYTGKETRMSMNSKVPRTKIGKLDLQINFLSKFLFLFMVFMSLVIVVLNGLRLSPLLFIQFFRYILLLCSIIPISMRVNLDFAKLVYCYKINMDKEISGTVARNSVIPEELGQIQFLLSDKTGTLTQNDMIFKKLSLEQLQFSHEDMDEIKKFVKKNCEKFDGPLEDIREKYLSGVKTKKLFRRDREFVIRDSITAMALCHNVTPIFSKENNMTVKEFQASSPDEIALVKTAEEIGIELKSRTQKEIVLKNCLGNEENYEILANFPFSSETKRMGIILRQKGNNKIIFYLKGADIIMKGKVPEVQRGFLLDESETLAREGLRTLVVTQKFLSEEEYNEWRILYNEASNSMENRQNKMREVINILEENMEFLCITGVEDKLQENVCQTLENIKNAGINVWMLTGDKIETAICIAISAGLKAIDQNIYTITDIRDELEMQNCLNIFSNQNNTVLVIDGVSLALAIDKHCKFFFDVSSRAPAVICCRCSPTQKSLITENIKKFTKKSTAAIGDGGNDVGMIQSADVGIGIVGKEGKQAALAADFSILQFQNLNKLLLWHGRLSYKRSAVLSQFVIHRGLKNINYKGLIISVIQAVFTCVFYFVAIPIYNGMLMLGNFI